jgi:hypothetical protein
MSFSLLRVARSRRTFRPIFPAVLLLGAAIPLGCFSGADLEDSTRFLPVTSSYPSAPCAEAIFLNSCSGAACHTGDEAGPPSGGIDLTSEGYPSRLYNQPATYEGLKPPLNVCPSVPEKLIDPAGVDQSLFWKKLVGMETCGSTMPVGLTLEQSEIDCLHSLVTEIIATPPAVTSP